MSADELRWRLFLAAQLSQENRVALAQPIAALAPLGQLINPARPDAIHLTLHFLGQFEVVRLGQLTGSLSAAVLPFRKFEVEVAGVGAFPTLSRPRVLWAGIGGFGLARLRDLKGVTGVAIQALGVATEPRVFAPHLTLARLRREAGPADLSAIKQWADRWGQAGFGALPIDSIHLMRSDLSQRPPRYTTIESFPLQ
ncbi:MAG: RNA 2',3'-cyclic phosphodiesterase [Candidatus Dormibacteria bacterium]